jgi:hypothetical protein
MIFLIFVAAKFCCRNKQKKPRWSAAFIVEAEAISL